MAQSVELIPVARLMLVFVPVGIVMVIFWRWSLGVGGASYAVARMLVQLLLIGYLLNFLFTTDSSLVVMGVLLVMLLAAGWISLQPLAVRSRGLYLRAAGAIAVAGVATLWLVTQGVLQAEPWYQPRIVIPLAGMIFANAMSTVSLGADRYAAERDNGQSYLDARRVAFRTAMIPQINALLAVGLVSLPGMMTGQILSGVSPLVAVRYQVMVMAMIFGSAGIATALFLAWGRGRDE